MGGSVRVFVDDAVMGRLPAICVKAGVVTGDRTVQRLEIGDSGLGIAWLLVLAGPLGWIGLVFISLTRRPTEILTVELPMSEEAYLRLQAARRNNSRASIWMMLSIVGILLAVVLPAHSTPVLGVLLACILVGSLVASVVVKVRASGLLTAASVRLGLDASRRWVTIDGVHPTFAYAAREQYDQYKGAAGQR